jgi:hypothetical protein
VIRGPEEVEESLPDLIVGSSGAARGGYSLWTVVLDNPFESRPDFSESIVPRDLLPLVFTASSGPFERIVQPPWVIKILHRISPARAAFGDGVRGFCPREGLVRFNGEETVSFHLRSQPARVVALHAYNLLDFRHLSCGGFSYCKREAFYEAKQAPPLLTSSISGGDSSV